MTLLAASNKLETELDILALEFSDFAASKPKLDSSSVFSLHDECLLEGLLSRVWQTWGHFCRACLFESCKGTSDANGKPIAALPGALSDAHVSAAAIHAKKHKNNACWTGATNNTLRYEPTWGDTAVAATCVPYLAPNNQAQLLSGFSAASFFAKALQTIRNGAAHDNAETRADINAMQAPYIVFPITHPTQALFWVVPTTSSYLISAAIDELKAAAAIMIS